MSDQSLEQLVEELYRLDPSLRQHEATIRPLLRRVLAAQPSLQLPSSILQRIQTTMNEQPMTSIPHRRPWLAMIGIPTLAAAAIVGVLYYPKSSPTTHQSTRTGVTVTSARQSAFGAFLSANHVNVGTASLSTVTTGSGEKMSVPATVSDTALEFSMMNTAITYSYGSSFTIPNLPVLQRVKGLDGATGITAGGLVSLNTFGGLKVDSATATQTTDDGYSITVDYREGTVSMYKNSGVSRVYPMIEPAVLGTKEGISSSPSKPVPLETIQESTALTNAKKFATQHGLPISSYEAPQIQYWPGQEHLTNGAVIAPATVLFPLSVQGQPVYDEGGNRYGIQMVVDADGAIISVYNLSSLSYTSSSYQVTSSTTAITDYLARGAWMWATKPTGTTKNYELQAPTTGYIISRYQVDQTTNEYLVPALIFGVQEKDQAATARISVVVPVLDALLKVPENSATKIDPTAIMEGGNAGTNASAPDDIVR